MACFRNASSFAVKLVLFYGKQMYKKYVKEQNYITEFLLSNNSKV